MFLILALTICAASRPYAAQLSVTWDEPTEYVDGTPFMDLAGYRVHYGTASRQYEDTVDVGTTTSATITNLAPHATYYLSVIAYSDTGIESEFSEELIWALDADSDTLPDTWEQEYFGSLDATNGAPAADYDEDGMSNEQEYIAGTDPSDDTSRALVHTAPNGASFRVSFRASEARGNAYQGRLRYYSLQQCENLPSAKWQTVPGYEAILATNQVVAYTLAPVVPIEACFYRSQVWLE